MRAMCYVETWPHILYCITLCLISYRPCFIFVLPLTLSLSLYTVQTISSLTLSILTLSYSCITQCKLPKITNYYNCRAELHFYYCLLLMYKAHSLETRRQYV